MSIMFTLPYFASMSSNVLAITSLNGMDESGFKLVLLHTPFANDATGVAVHRDGRFAEIAHEKWGNREISFEY